MKSFMIFVIALLASTALAQSPSIADGAVLNCDTAVHIKAIDGDTRRETRNEGYGWENCGIPLEAGPHTIDICYNLYRLSSKYRIPIPLRCKENQQVVVDAQAGHVYRVKLLLEQDSWRGWIEDVTALEAGLPDDTPRINKRKKKTVPKSERKSLVLLKLSPSKIRVPVDFGDSMGVWFNDNYIGVTRPLFKTEDPQGFSLLELEMGDTFALQGVMYWDDSVFSGVGGAGPCGDTYFPVFEDLPGGKLLYMGHFDVETGDPHVLSFDQRGLEEARAWLEKAKPGTGAKLETMPFRWGRSRIVCNTVRGTRLINAAGQPAQKPTVSPGAASAD